MTKVAKLKLLSQIVTVTAGAKISEADLDFLPSGYKLMHLANNTECGDYRHHALAIYNENDKEIIISNYGTHIDIMDPITTVHDLYADLQLSLKQIPSKYSSTAKFVEQIRSLLGDEYKDYKITCAGHSLGGFLSQLASVEFKALGFENVQTVAFDSPGAKEVSAKLAAELEYDGDLESGVENYLTKPNLVNKTNEHLGKIIYVPKLEQHNVDNSLFHGINNHTLWNFSTFFEKCEANNPETELLEAKNWDNKLIMMENCADLHRISSLNPDYIQFNRANNGTNPEYISYEDIDQDWGMVNLYDHNDLINYYAGNYDSPLTEF
jgi:hypothetical protein